MEILKNLAFPTVALVIGAVMLFLAIVKKVKTKFVEFPEIKTNPQRLQLGIIGIILIVASFFLQYYTPTPSPQSESTETIAAAQSTISALETKMASPFTMPSETAMPSETLLATPNTIEPLFTFTPTSTPIPIETLVTPVLTPVSTTQEFCVNFYSVVVRIQPGSAYPSQSILKNPNNLSDPVCLEFDYRLPDNTWVRIAPNQPNSDYREHELGWIPANQLRPNDIDILRIYVPESVLNGKYCATSRNGVYVRTCPNDSCIIKGTLYPRDCIIINARSTDNRWVKISSNQDDEQYLIYSEHWISSYYIAPFDLSAEWQSFLQYYLELLPIATPPPIPEG